MKTNKLNIDIKRYLSGNMTTEERKAFEQRMDEDIFLRESVEGYRSMETTPHDLKLIKPSFAKTGKSNRLFVWPLVVVAASLALVFMVKFLNPESEKQYHPVVPDQHISLNLPVQPVITCPEMDTIREEKDTSMQLDIKSGDTIRAEKKQRYSVPPLYRLSPGKIHVTKNHPDGSHWQGISNHLYGYLEGYKVVDYRVDMRQNKKNFTIPRVNTENRNDDLKHLGEKHSYFDFLAGALEKYDAGDYEYALYDFRIILNQYPKDANALFYAGMCHYNEGNFSKSIHVMDRVLEHDINTFDQDARWYMALAYREQEYMDTCLTLLSKIASEDSYYGAKAGNLIEQIKSLKK
jgi:hypothetical protein